MQIRVLGPVEASVEERSLPLGGAKQRAVLAMLALEANRTVSAERLIEGLWGEDVPASAHKMLQTYVWRLRGLLAADGGAEIVTHGRGYELRIDPERIDVRRLERLVAEAGHNGGGAAHAAVALFRGDPLADISDTPFAAPEIRRLEELRLTASELALKADLAAGRHQEVIGEIEALLAETRCASVFMACGCWRSTAAGVRPRRSPPTRRPAGRSSRRSASSRGPSCDGCRTRCCARTHRSIRSPGSRTSRASSTRRTRHRWPAARASCGGCRSTAGVRPRARARW